MNKSLRRNYMTLAVLAAAGLTLSSGCTLVDAAGLETFAVDLLRNIAAALLL